MELESQLAAKYEENATLSRDLSQLKTAQKRLMDKHRDTFSKAAKNYSTLKSELDNFKLSTESVVSEAKAAKDGFTALRESARTGLRDLKSMCNDNGQFILTTETRETVRELHSELSKNLLRDKLYIMGTELAEARGRVSELEGLATADRNQSESIALKIRQSADQILEVTRYLEEQKHESVQATAKACIMEEQLVDAQASLQEARSVMTSMKEEMTAREEFHAEQGAKLRTLRHTIDFQEENMKVIEARAQKAEEELVQASNHNHELQGRLDAAKGLEKNLTQQASRLLSEHDEVKEKLRSLERQLAEVQAREKSLSSNMAKISTERDALVDKLKSFDDVKREVDMYREKYSGCQVSLKVLQEQFDDKCVALAASKESIGELQETLAELKSETVHLQEQNRVLKTERNHADKEVEDKSASLQALQIELSRKEGAFQAFLETERSGKNEALDQVHEAKTKVESLLIELAQKDHQMKGMTRRLTAAETPSTEHEQEVAALKVRIAELEATEKKLANRAVTITHRYENHDLNDNEKALVAQLMQKTRSIHDKEMVEKTNALKLRENIIKQHEARIIQLENILKHRFQEESSAKSTDEQSNSMAVDATKRQRPSSDHHPGIRGAGHEDPSTTVTHGATDGAPANPSFPSPSSRSTGCTTFAKLCREDTDDIASFEDEKPPVATGKRVMFAEVEDEPLRPARRVKHGRASGVEKLAVDEAVASASGTGSGSVTGNKKKAAPKRR
ncbi:hypothetical protein V8E55_005397 [Tylopilus felleus]